MTGRARRERWPPPAPRTSGRRRAGTRPPRRAWPGCRGSPLPTPRCGPEERKAPPPKQRNHLERGRKQEVRMRKRSDFQTMHFNTDQSKSEFYPLHLPALLPLYAAGPSLSSRAATRPGWQAVGSLRWRWFHRRSSAPGTSGKRSVDSRRRSLLVWPGRFVHSCNSETTKMFVCHIHYNLTGTKEWRRRTNCHCMWSEWGSVWLDSFDKQIMEEYHLDTHPRLCGPEVTLTWANVQVVLE